MASKWHSLGEALLFDEDILDEIFTNNETDEGCLRDMLERYLEKSDMSHTWEEIEAAQKRINMEEHGIKINTCTVLCAGQKVVLKHVYT